MKGTWLSIFLLLVSCSGYHVAYRDNPFEIYGISSLTIPTFVNQSTLANVSAPFSKEISLLLSHYRGLRVYQGENQKADAILLGIISSNKRYNSTFSTAEKQFTSGDLKDSIGERREFYLPSKTNYKLSLRLVLIKNPTLNEIELARNNPEIPLENSKIIFDEILDLQGSYYLALKDTKSVDRGGVVNFTKNKSFLEDNIQELSQTAAKQFKEVVLDAF